MPSSIQGARSTQSPSHSFRGVGSSAEAIVRQGSAGRTDPSVRFAHAQNACSAAAQRRVGVCGDLVVKSAVAMGAWDWAGHATFAGVGCHLWVPMFKQLFGTCLFRSWLRSSFHTAAYIEECRTIFHLSDLYRSIESSFVVRAAVQRCSSKRSHADAVHHRRTRPMVAADAKRLPT